MSFAPKTANTYSQGSAPSGYVGGAGRGAQGFTTRSDIGPARPSAPSDDSSQFGQAPAGYQAGRGRGMGDLARGQGELKGPQAEVDKDRGDYSESNYDEFSGYSGSLAQNTPYDDDDVEADRIYEAIDERMDSRHKRRREVQMLENLKKNKTDRPKIADQFADLKRDLATVTSTEWDAIPDVGDHSLDHKQRKRKEVFTPLPDHILHGAAQQVGPDKSAHVEQTGGDVSSMTGMAEARGTMLSLKLDKMSDSVSGQTVVDPRGYLTDLNSMKINSMAEVGDIKKARTLLGSVTATNPKHGPGWIAAARVEEFAGKMVAARKIIRQGCEAAPDAEDVWLEAARLHDRDNARTILAQGVKNLPTSVKIWLLAADMETSDDRKKIVLRRALEFIPSSVKLWKTAIELENEDDARIMLARAVECVPHSVDMWLALAKLETYENARKVLNMAREAIPTEPLIWITAAKLEEVCNPDPADVVERIIEKAIASLSQYQVVIERDKWLKDAEAAEHSGAPLVCGAIVRQTIKLGVDEEDRMLTWLDDADVCLSRPSGPSIVTARAIYAYTLTQFPKKTKVWLDAVQLEKEYGTRESLEELLRQAVLQCPHSEILWLMGAKEKWLAGQVPDARAILVNAFAANPNSEQIWLAAVKLEWENNEIERARILLSKARDRASTKTVWLKSALLARERGDVTETLSLLDEAINKYPSFEKFYMMAGQACEELLHDNSRAKIYYQQGMKSCPESTTLVILTVQLYETTQGVSKARSLIELARLKSPKNENLWLETIRLERRNNNEKLADTLMARALQECPNSGILWAEELLTCPKPSQKSKSIDALKKCNDDPFVIVAVARLFERDRKIPKARKWFNRAVTLNPDYGDAWAYYYAFEIKASGANAPETQNVLQQCVNADPRHGELWCSVSKQTANRRSDTATLLKKIIVEKVMKANEEAK